MSLLPSDKKMAGGQECQGECVILLVLFGERPYVKVLIYIIIIPRVPRVSTFSPWYSSLAG